MFLRNSPLLCRRKCCIISPRSIWKKLGMHGSLLLHWPYWPNVLREKGGAGHSGLHTQLHSLSFFGFSGSVRSVSVPCLPADRPARVFAMPDISKSDISANLDRDKMFSELWWLNYCFCEGVGIGAVGNPFFGGEAVNICLHSKCEMTDVGDPFCSSMRVCLCITDQCALPPAKGSPICVCFNKKLAGDDGWSGQQLFDWSTGFGDTFWIYYIFCLGCGVTAPSANGRPLFAVQFKELCIKGGTKLATPMEGGKICSAVSTRLCLWDQCAMPPAEGAPMFVCCNFLNPKTGAKPLAYGG